jgi:CheY-like chemotaxis protein
MISEFLRDAGFDVAEAGDADEAVAIFESGSPIDLLFSDVKMRPWTASRWRATSNVNGRLRKLF